MSTDGSSLRTDSVSSVGSAPTLADIIRVLTSDPTLGARERGELCSAVRTLARVLNRELDAIPANPSRLRAMLSPITPAVAGVTRGRWSNIISLTLKALKRAGIPTAPGKFRDRLAPEWEELRARLPDPYAKAKLSRFMSYCSARGVVPEEVTGTTFDIFAEVLDVGMMRDPGEVDRESRKTWNAAASTIPGWPHLIVPLSDRRKLFADHIATFPPSFRADLEEFLRARENPDIFSDAYSKPVRPITNRTRRQNILVAASALVKSGFLREQLTNLDVLVELDNFKAALRFLFERAGAKKSGYIHHVATTLKTIAKKYCCKDEKTLKAITELCSNLNPGHSGLTEKNKAALRQFADRKALYELLSLPNRIVAEADAQPGERRTEAVRMTYAIAIAIELVIPLRARNLAGLRLGQLHRVDDRVLLSVLLDETKNENPIDAEFPPWLVRMIDIYLVHYRPRMLSGPSPWLLPGEDGGRRNSGGFGAQIADFVAKEAGVIMTLHQFRHLAAKLYLDRHPGDYETVRRLLGHKTQETTRRFYHELESVMAVRRYGDLITEFLEDPIARPGKLRRRSR